LYLQTFEFLILRNQLNNTAIKNFSDHTRQGGCALRWR